MNRTLPLAALLALSVGVAAWLSFETFTAERSHRQAAEAVLADYASLAAEEWSRRAASEAGFQGWVRWLQPTELPNPLAARTFEIQDGVLRQLSGPPFDEGDSARLLATISTSSSSKPRGERAPYVTVIASVDGGRALVVLSRSDAPRAGFQVLPKALAPLLARAANQGPILPESLTHGREVPGLALAMRDPSGREIYRSGAAASGAIVVRRPLGETYAGALRGFTAEVALDPRSAETLVVGGLPRSRRPVVFGLLTVALALAVSAFLVVRRERILALQRESFVTSVSHELRTPLAQIRLFAETLLLGRTRNDEEARRALTILDREARRLSQLVENVLLASRSARGAPLVSRAPCDVSRVAAETLEAFRPLAEARDVRLEPDIPPALQANADAGALAQILLNLLDNAVKHGPPSSAVALAVSNGHGLLTIAVSDRGPGVPEAHRERVFAPFERIDASAERTGTGLGLSVVRDLARAHGGRAYVQAREGGGARFVVEIPSEVPA